MCSRRSNHLICWASQRPGYSRHLTLAEQSPPRNGHPGPAGPTAQADGAKGGYGPCAGFGESQFWDCKNDVLKSRGFKKKIVTPKESRFIAALWQKLNSYVDVKNFLAHDEDTVFRQLLPNFCNCLQTIIQRRKRIRDPEAYTDWRRPLIQGLRRVSPGDWAVSGILREITSEFLQEPG